MIRTPIHTVREWVEASRANGIYVCGISNRLLAKELHVCHCRSGKIEKRVGSKEARGKAVLAYGFDEIGNIVALCADGYTRQFI